MGFGLTELSCPRCMTLCEANEISTFLVICIIIISIVTLGLGLIIGIIYFLYIKNQTIECHECGFKWKP